MLLLVIFALVLRLIDAGSGSSDEENGNEVTASSEGIQCSERLASSESSQCRICGLCVENLAVHITVHNHQKSFRCSHCDKQFMHASTLRTHQRIHSGKKLHNCSVCGKQFTLLSKLWRHSKTHTDVKAFRCAECGKQFTYAHSLSSHQRLHTDEKFFVRPDCGKKFACADHLKSHQRVHSEAKPFHCTECGKHSKHCNTLREQHRCTPPSMKSFGCPKCGEQFRTGDDLQIHQRTHIGVKFFGCSHCARQFLHAGNMYRHLRKHTDEKPFECLRCGKRFARVDYLKSHQQNKHAGLEISTGSPSLGKAERSTAERSNALFSIILENSVKSLPMDVTNSVIFNYSSSVPIELEDRNHTLSFDQKKNFSGMENSSLLTVPEIVKSTIFQVDVAMENPFVFQTVSNNPMDHSSLDQMDNVTELILLPSRHTDDEAAIETNYFYRICRRAFHPARRFTPEFLLEYDSEVTASSKPFQSNQQLASSESALCHICGLCFRNLAVHMSFHNHQKPFSCSQCGKQFRRARNLQSHQKMHSSEELHDCPICDKQFTHPSRLRKHRQIHNDVKSFRCAECGKQFAHCSYLRTHQRTHTGEKPFTCPDCGKRFARADNLRTHQYIHTSVKSFRCTECGKQFTRPYSLLQHQRMHSGVNLFNCTHCGMQFTYSSNMRRHLRKHTGEKPFECLKCGKLFARADYLKDHQQKKHALLENSTRGSSLEYTEVSTVAAEGPSPFQIIFRNFLDNSQRKNISVIQSSVQINNLTVMENSSFVHPVLEIPVHDKFRVEKMVSTAIEDQFPSQSTLENPVGNTPLIQINNPTVLESRFLLHVENPMHESFLPQNPTQVSFLDHLQSPNIFENSFLFQDPMHNPSQVHKKEDAVLENLINIPSFIRTNTQSESVTHAGSAPFPQMQENISMNAEESVRDVQLSSFDSDIVTDTADIECPVCFERFGERKSLEDHMNDSCSLFPLDWLSFLAGDHNDDLAK